MNEDEHKRIEERERAHLARQITQNPLWAETWNAIESLLTAQWAHSAMDASERRENIYLQLNAARAAKKAIEQVLLTGEMAEKQLQERSNGRAGPKH